jgi:hypothetical protein
MPETLSNGRVFERFQFRSGEVFPSVWSSGSAKTRIVHSRSRRRSHLLGVKTTSHRPMQRDRSVRNAVATQVLAVIEPLVPKLELGERGGTKPTPSSTRVAASGKRQETRPCRVQNNPVRNMTSVQPSTTSIPAPLAAAASSSFSAPGFRMMRCGLAATISSINGVERAGPR